MKDLSAGMKIALLIMLISFLYMFAVTFFQMPEAGSEHSKTIVGFFIGDCIFNPDKLLLGQQLKPE